jgi:hypothetical protein
MKGRQQYHMAGSCETCQESQTVLAPMCLVLSQELGGRLTCKTNTHSGLQAASARFTATTSTRSITTCQPNSTHLDSSSLATRTARYAMMDLRMHCSCKQKYIWVRPLVQPWLTNLHKDELWVFVTYSL